jgi:iron complex outermembrane receptor protein
MSVVSHRAPVPRNRAALQRTTLVLALLACSQASISQAEDSTTSNTADTSAADAAVRTTLDAVVVSAQKGDRTRTVDVASTPSAVSSLSAETLEKNAIVNVRQLGSLVPNVVLAENAVSYANITVSMRGITEADPQGEPSTAFYHDDLYWPKNLGANQELLDVESIEVLRGPQGQAFGHAAIAGAIRVNSTIPTAETRIRLLTSYGNHDARKFAFAASGALNPLGNVLGSAALTIHQRDGFNHNVTVGKDVNNVDYKAGRGKFLWWLADATSLTFSAAFVRDTSTARGVQNVLYGLENENSYNQIYPQNNYRSNTSSITFDHSFDAHLRLKAFVGTTEFYQDADFDNYGDYWSRGSQLVIYGDRTYQSEFSLHGDYDRVQFSTGLYYYYEDWYTNRRANTGAVNSTVADDIRYRPVYSLIDQGTDNYAVYGELRLHQSDALSYTFGLRYNYERHSQDNQLYNLVADAPYQSTAYNYLDILYNAQPQDLLWDAHAKRSWDTWAPRLSVDYEWRPGLLGYATYSEGTKSAGFDYRAQTTSINGKIQAEAGYDPEKARNFELGLKSTWIDGRLGSNIAVFFTRFDDTQITTTDYTLATPISRRYNAGRASSRGLELEGYWQASENLRIDFSSALLRAKLEDFSGPTPTYTDYGNGIIVASGPDTGSRLPYSPTRQGRLALSWQLPLAGHNASLLFNSAISYQSESYSSITNDSTTRLPSQTYLSGGISYQPDNQPWSLTLSGLNLTDRRYRQGTGYSRSSDGVSAYTRATNYNDPRTYTLAFRYALGG